MSLRKTTREDFSAHLAALGIVRGMDLLVQSQLTSFGVIEGGVAAIYAALRDAVGSEATLAVPAYRLRPEASTQLFNRHTSPSQDAGVLAEFVRQIPEAVRSDCQMHSHAAVGPKAALLDDVSGNVSFGPGSDFDAMHRAGFHLLMLGCDFRIATFAIHVQGMHGEIPYREWLELPRPRVGNPDATCRYYARVRPGADEDLNIVGDRLRAQGKVKTAAAPYGGSAFLSLADFHECEMEMLRSDPEFLIRGKAA